MKKQPSAGSHQRARTLRRSMTEAERRLWQILRLRQIEGCRFCRQVPIGRFIADFACHETKMIIEIDGGQHDSLAESEMNRTRFLKSEGYRVVRFWNNEVPDNLEGVRAVIAENLRPVHPRPSPIKGEGARITLPLDGGGFGRG